MSTICSCDTGASGFGLIDCYGAPDRVVGLGFQQLKSGGGNNVLTAPISQASWESALWNKDGSLRISLLSDVKAYTSERDDAVTETIDTIDYFISEGKKMVSFQLIGTPAKLKQYVDSLRCQTIGFYGVSASGQLLGKRESADEIVPIPIQNQTIYSKIIDKTKETLAKMQVTFMIDERFDDADLVFIPSDQITADLLTTEALIEATATAGATTTTTTSMEIQLDFSLSGQVSAATTSGLEPLQNFDVTTYFAIYNNTTLASVAVSGVTESSTTAGLYTLTFTAQTTADVLEFSAPTASPFYFTPFTATSL